jgi:murein DD-endopeptidase MepM/ murein hydrolase activator NlpD
VKNRIYKSLFLGMTSAIAASASYALITPRNLEVPVSINAIATPSIYDATADFLSDTTPQIQYPLTVDYKIKPNENLSTIFEKFELDKTTLYTITHANEVGQDFADLDVGKTLEIKINAPGELEYLIYKKDAINTLIATRSDDGFDVKMISAPIEREIATVQGTIQNSLFLDAKQAGLPDKLIMKLADIFAWDIDFAQNLKDGDQFTVVYEKFLVEGKQVYTGDIVATEFVNKGKAFSAIRYKDKEGKVTYYTPQGKVMRKTFLTSPVDFVHISSYFNLHRRHPILNTIRAHKGVDYAATTGTPVKTVGDGKIVFRGTQHGYGNVIIVQHGEKYTTLYGHLSRFQANQTVGSSVGQGEVIGYVGQTGLATGPHLHYEFRIDGVHQNPLTAHLPDSLAASKDFLAEFKAQTQPFIDKLNQLTASTPDIKVDTLMAQKKHS